MLLKPIIIMNNEEIKELAIDMSNKTIIWGNYKNIKEAKCNFPIKFIKIKNIDILWFENALIYWSDRWRSNYFKHNADGEKKLKNTWINILINKVNNNNNNYRSTVTTIINNDNQTENNLITNALISLRNNT